MGDSVSPSTQVLLAIRRKSPKRDLKELWPYNFRTDGLTTLSKLSTHLIRSSRVLSFPISAATRNSLSRCRKSTASFNRVLRSTETIDASDPASMDLGEPGYEGMCTSREVSDTSKTIKDCIHCNVILTSN